MAHPNLLVGRVIEVSGGSITAELSTSLDELYRTHKSRRYTVGQVGSIVKIISGDILVFATVTALRMVEEEVSTADSGPSRKDTKWIELELLGQGTRTGVGEANFQFRRGVTSYPLPGELVYVATERELAQLYCAPDVPSIELGRMIHATGLPIHVRVDDFLGKHFAILGTTGSGKSCAVASVINAVTAKYAHAHILIIDPHNEYTSAFSSCSLTYDPTELSLPHWLLTLEESIELYIGKTEHVATSQANILKNAILASRRRYCEKTDLYDIITPDTPSPYRLGDLVQHIESATPATSASSREPYLKILSKIETLRSDKRLSFIIKSDKDVEDNLSAIVGRLFSIPCESSPITILDLSGVPTEIVDVVVSLLARTIFDFAVWAPPGRRLPMLLVCEEAHRYVPRQSAAAIGPARAAVERIAKEGRKYGVGLGLITQRPSELSETVLAQCNTIVALRVTNEADQTFVRRCFPDGIKSMVDALSALGNQEALIVGQAVGIPARIRFADLPVDRRPRSRDLSFSDIWQDGSFDKSFTDTVVARWRRQDRSS